MTNCYGKYSSPEFSFEIIFMSKLPWQLPWEKLQLYKQESSIHPSLALSYTVTFTIPVNNASSYTCIQRVNSVSESKYTWTLWKWFQRQDEDLHVLMHLNILRWLTKYIQGFHGRCCPWDYTKQAGANSSSLDILCYQYWPFSRDLTSCTNIAIWQQKTNFFFFLLVLQCAQCGHSMEDSVCRGGKLLISKENSGLLYLP